ncbi:MAG: 30S ribosome-binding factor RbfA [Alphaproteobacteria bacterium]
MSKHRDHAPSQRQLRVGEEVRHVLSKIIERGEINDPDLAGLSITVTEVRVSPDMRNATAYVMPLGGATDEDGMKTIIKALGRAAPFLRHRVAQSVHLRNVPRLMFIADTSFDVGDHIDALLRTPGIARDIAHVDDGEEPDDGA